MKIVCCPAREQTICKASIVKLAPQLLRKRPQGMSREKHLCKFPLFTSALPVAGKLLQTAVIVTVVVAFTLSNRAWPRGRYDSRHERPGFSKSYPESANCQLQGLVVGRFSSRPRVGQDQSRCECCSQSECCVE